MFESLYRKLSKKFSREHYPGVPDPHESVESLYRTVVALKQGYEQLTRTRGRVGKSALLVEELSDFAEAFESTLGSATVEQGEPGRDGTDGTDGVDGTAGDLIDDAIRSYTKTWSSRNIGGEFDRVRSEQNIQDVRIFANTKVFFQTAQPTDVESSAGDLWFVSGYD